MNAPAPRQTSLFDEPDMTPRLAVLAQDVENETARSILPETLSVSQDAPQGIIDETATWRDSLIEWLSWGH